MDNDKNIQLQKEGFEYKADQFILTPLLKEIDKYCGEGKNEILLDLGAHKGFFSTHMLDNKKFRKVIGFEYMFDFIKVAPLVNENIKPVSGDARYVPIKTNSIKYCLSKNLLGRVGQFEKVLDEINRILKKDGYLFLMINNYSNTTIFEENAFGGPNKLSASYLKKILQNKGFKILSFKAGGFPCRIYPPLLQKLILASRTSKLALFLGLLLNPAAVFNKIPILNKTVNSLAGLFPKFGYRILFVVKKI